MNYSGKIAQEQSQLGAPQTLRATAVNWLSISAEQAGQRIDNFLLRLIKGVPKSHIYRIIRAGEVRVNKKRVAATYRLVNGDQLRVPPLRIAVSEALAAPASEFPTLFEDEALLIINKPAAVAVHGGSGLSFGVIEQLRAARPQARFLELVHRLDRDTSGILMLAKKRSALTALHADLRDGKIHKHYDALVSGAWHNPRQHIKAPLEKYLLANGERRVRVSAQGVPAHTIVTLCASFGAYSLLDVELCTGRTHQIRVHLAHLGFPIVGDDKYGSYQVNQDQRRGVQGQAFKRMFLHARQLNFIHPITQQTLTLTAPLPAECRSFLENLSHAI